MKEEIKRATAVLVEQALWDCTRAADLASFQFGQRRSVKGYSADSREVGEYALHVQCPWRITRDDLTIVGSGDLYCPPDLWNKEPDLNFDWRPVGANRRDHLLKALFQGGARVFVVQSVEVGNAGSVRIGLEDDHSLEVIPDLSTDDEQWRLFRPYREHEPHFVVTGKGIES